MYVKIRQIIIHISCFSMLLDAILIILKYHNSYSLNIFYSFCVESTSYANRYFHLILIHKTHFDLNFV